MKTSRAVVEVDASGTIRLPRLLRDVWHPTGKLEASVIGEQLVLSPIPAEAPGTPPAAAAHRIAALREWLAGLPRHHSRALSDQAVSRASIYD